MNSPLITDKLDFSRKYPEALATRFPHLQLDWFLDLGQGIARDKVLLVLLPERIEKTFLYTTGEFRDTWIRIRNIVLSSIKLQIDHITKDLKNAEVEEATRVLSTIIKDAVIVHRAYQKVQIMNFHNQLTDKSLAFDGVFEVNFGTKMEFTGDLIVLKDYPGGPVVITYPMLLSVLDKIEAHFS